MKYLGHETASGPYPVPVGFCVTQKSWDKEHRAKGMEPSLMPTSIGCVSSFVQAHGATFLIVTFSPQFKSHTRIEQVGVVAHEAVHVWQFIEKVLQERDAGWEVEACGVAWVTQWLLECLEAKGWLK